MQLTINSTRKITRNELANSYRDTNFFLSFPWESDNQVIERYERESTTTFEGLANTIANYWINFGVNQLLKCGNYPSGLDEFALIQFDERCPELKAVKDKGTQIRPDMVLQISEMRHQLSQTLKAFEHSKSLQQAWIKLQYGC